MCSQSYSTSARLIPNSLLLLYFALSRRHRSRERQCATMLPFFLFCIYLTTNLGSLLLASAAQKKKTKFLAGLKVPASACRSPQREMQPTGPQPSASRRPA